VNLTDIDNEIRNPSILHKESTDGVWLLNAGMVIEQGATLYINSTDTSWLKIAADGETAYPILVSGSLKIDSVKVTSWNPYTNNYAITDDSDRNGKDTTIGTPRPYITVEVEATGTTDIINSEIAYLGYEGGYGAGRTGLRYEGGDGSIIKGNNIHDMWFGLYTKGVGGLLIDLLTEEEEDVDLQTRYLRFDIDLLDKWLIGATDCLVAAAQRQKIIKAIVSRGGRPDFSRFRKFI
jgi:mannuronan 5-epimerase